MSLSGGALKAKLAQLMCEHGVQPLERAPIPLSPPQAGPQIVEGVAASPDIDAERMSFTRGSLSWPVDPGKIPLLIRHDPKRIAGRILALDYRPDGRARLDRRSRSRADGWIVGLRNRD
jgi:hypothetical protein